MKKYIFSNAAATWWAEYQTDGMQTTDNQKIMGIRSQSVGGTLNHTDLDSTMVAMGLPNKVGLATTEVTLVGLATSLNLNLKMVYENVSAVTKYTALTVQTTPTFSIASGTSEPWGTAVTISSASATKIYYTIDGSVPTTASIDQSVTPLVTGSTVKVVRALAVRTGYYQSLIASATYPQSVQTTPTFSPVAGAVPGSQAITISSASATKIYYTTDGTTPTISSTDQSVTPLVLTSFPVTVKALAVRTNYANSVVGTAAYTQSITVAPTSATLAVGGATPVGGVTNVVIPAAGATDNTGKVTGWVTGTANKIKFTVVDAASESSTITINGGAYTSAADYAITATGVLTISVTTTRANYVTTVYTFTVAVSA